jgi:hypothetical protein
MYPVHALIWERKVLRLRKAISAEYQSVFMLTDLFGAYSEGKR